VGKTVIVGNVAFNEEMVSKVHKITPVPGGVGPMTVTMLMNNLTVSWLRASNKIGSLQSGKYVGGFTHGNHEGRGTMVRSDGS
jgi:hypothetical protein